ncbi:MAG: hypothetical protein IPJ52_00835 [Rhodocyclaceae bacterium]|nr:hypothetical protein [Rhodocyclaceae bacterium]
MSISVPVVPHIRRMAGDRRGESAQSCAAGCRARGAFGDRQHVRDIAKQVFGFAALHGDKCRTQRINAPHRSPPLWGWRPRAVRVVRDPRHAPGAGTPTATLPTIRPGAALILLTLVRKSELIEAMRDEVDFLRTPSGRFRKSRGKAGKPHYRNHRRSKRSDIMVALRTCASGSKFLPPSRYDAADRRMSKAT